MATPNTPQKPGGFGKFSRTLSFWLIAFLIPIVLIQYAMKGSEAVVEVDASVYYQQLDAGNISKVTVIGGKEIVGEFRNRFLVRGREVKGFKTLLPIANNPEDMKRLEAKGVVLKAQEPRPSLVAVLVSLLPWVLILGIWIFLFRQMQAGGNKAFSFGKSKAKLLSGDTPNITFADVAGADES